MNDFDTCVADSTGTPLAADGINTIQVNVGLTCNQACEHCHLDCGPDRTEVMEWATMESVLAVVDATVPSLVDITGGAPDRDRQSLLWLHRRPGILVPGRAVLTRVRAI